MKDLLPKYESDVFLYYGGISRTGYHVLSTLLESKLKKKSKVCLILVTNGGDPDAGFRIARSLRSHYPSVEIMIPDVCKSAGTLICIGADKLIFGDRGELGPLDIQISKPDELFESMSGLDLIQALAALQHQVLNSFRHYLVDIRGGSRLRTKLAAEIASKLTEDFIAPIAAKIDPVTLGEHQRAMQIGFDYGRRLNDMSNALRRDALNRLVSDYSSHGFVIDREEAKEIFSCVEHPNEEGSTIINWTRKVIQQHLMPELPAAPIVIDVADHFEKSNDNEESNEPEPSNCGENQSGEPKSSSESNEKGTGDKPSNGTAPSESTQNATKGNATKGNAAKGNAAKGNAAKGNGARAKVRA